MRKLSTLSALDQTTKIVNRFKLLLDWNFLPLQTLIMLQLSFHLM